MGALICFHSARCDMKWPRALCHICDCAERGSGAGEVLVIDRLSIRCGKLARRRLYHSVENPLLHSDWVCSRNLV
jgi:hypothetical protein